LVRRPPSAINDNDIPSVLGGSHTAEISPTGREQRVRDAAGERPWKTWKEMADMFAAIRKTIGDEAYYAILRDNGIVDAEAFKAMKSDKALTIYRAMKQQEMEVAA
jgi:hypothetical protein